MINDRLDLIDELIHHEGLRDEIRSLLKRTFDSQRLVQKFSFGRGDADDLLSLARTIYVTRRLGSILEESNLNGSPSITRLLARFNREGPDRLADRISQAIDEDGLMIRQRTEEVDAAEVAGHAKSVIADEAERDDLQPLAKRLNSKRFSKTTEAEEKVALEDVWIMRRHASPTLSDLHDALQRLVDEKTTLRVTLRSRLNASTLTLKMTPGLGHICHVKGKDTKTDLSILGNARAVSSSKSTKSFYLPEWTILGSRIDEAKLRIRAEEQAIFQSLREDVITNLAALRRNAAALDELDVGTSFAILANEHELVRPQLDHSNVYDVRGGRHISVESGLDNAGRSFTPNDCTLGSIQSQDSSKSSSDDSQNEDERIWLITGPNMAGKSTFLRQTALISILAQTGSFVPASSAQIGLVDAVYSRVGSADNLAHDQSTFMVEMLETASILKRATSRSLIVMDEVGRGTTPEDGLAVGYAVLRFLCDLPGVRVLFATHFHRLAEMFGGENGTSFQETVGCYCTRVVEDNSGGFRFDHRMRRGVNRDSHALKVARLAGLPESAIGTAKQVLKDLKVSTEGAKQ